MISISLLNHKTLITQTLIIVKMVKIKHLRLLNKAKKTYSSNDVYDKFLTTRKQILPSKVLIGNKIDSKKLGALLEGLNLNSDVRSTLPEGTNVFDVLDLGKLNELDIDSLKNLNSGSLEKLGYLNNLNKFSGLDTSNGLGNLKDLESLSKVNDLSSTLETIRKFTESMNQSNLNNKGNNQSNQNYNQSIPQNAPTSQQNISQTQQEDNSSNDVRSMSSFEESNSPPVNQSNQQSSYNNQQADELKEQQTSPKNSVSYSQMPNYNQQLDSSGLNKSMENLNNVVGSLAPAINVVSKNYIDPKKFEELDKEFEEEDQSKKLAKIPDNLLKTSTTDWEPINYRGINISYDLYDLAKVHIQYDESEQKVLYQIIEPVLTDEEKEYLEELKKGFIYVFEKFSPEFIDLSGKDLVIEGTKKLCLKYKIKLTDEQFQNITYYLVRDFLGLEDIEPIFHDPYIEDISCDGLNTPIFVNHLKYGPLEVNRKYSDPALLNSFIIKLAQRSNQEVSLSKPILQGALPDGSRIEAIYGKEISEKGSSFTIRKFREEPFTPIHLIDFGTIPPFVLSYLWIAIENKQSVIVSGGTATGKTTILNALSLFCPPSSKIVSIEDTPEINLPHEHWLSLVARESEGKSEVSMFDLLKASLRERPDYIIVGEIRGVEASILFQGMATGHAGLGTVHAEKFEDLVNRMTIPPISLPKQLLTELKIAIFMKQMKVKNNMVRRVNSIVEVVDYNPRADKFYTNEFVTYVPLKDEFKFKEKSAILSKLLVMRGGSEESLWTEVERRRRILDTMHKKKILEFKEVSNIIKAYYKEPSKIFEYIDSFTPDIKEEK